ncbi:MAG: hypothetical protein JNM07_09675 [Phycisphaerae bacterium]|nr:hypothetical protein [Phycisphaerae bacterium]
MFVVVVSAILATIGLCVLAMGRTRLAISGLDADSRQAALNAQSGLELSLRAIETDATWRVSKGVGRWFNNLSTGRGSVTVDVEDPTDTNASDDAADPLVVTSTGLFNSARQGLRVRLNAIPVPPTCLQAALVAGGGISFQSATVTSTGSIAANATIAASSALVTANVESAGQITGGTYVGVTRSGAPARTMPSAQEVIAAYTAMGSPMSIAMLKDDGNSGNQRAIEDALISPAHNPFGLMVNAKGIYILDCQNRRVRIRKSRILGTLVLLNPGNKSTVESSVCWDPAASGYPCLIVLGSIQIDLRSSLLSESSSGVNFNPSGAPYLGRVDTDALDSYPSGISGLTYVSGDLSISGTSRLGTVVIVGGVATISGSLYLAYDASAATSPPPGFAGSYLMRIAAGSLERMTY